MGAEVSSCCGGGSNGTENDPDLDVAVVSSSNAFNSGGGVRHRAPGTTPHATTQNASTYSINLDPKAKEDFARRLEEGIDVHLILQDKTKLLCKVRLDRSKDFILLSCDIVSMCGRLRNALEKKVRAIGMRDIKAILHTPEQLRRVETSAGITDTDTCAAIHLAASGNCIPLFFLNSVDKAYFVALVEEAY